MDYALCYTITYLGAKRRCEISKLFLIVYLRHWMQEQVAQSARGVTTEATVSVTADKLNRSLEQRDAVLFEPSDNDRIDLIGKLVFVCTIVKELVGHTLNKLRLHNYVATAAFTTVDHVTHFCGLAHDLVLAVVQSHTDGNFVAVNVLLK